MSTILGVDVDPLPVKDELEILLAAIAYKEGMSLRNVLTGQHQPVVRVRRKFCKEARKLGYSFPQIGRAIGRHHSTVIHLVQT